MRRLAIVITHPIQYYIPMFQILAKHVTLKVFFTAGQGTINKYDEGFRQHIAWDIPLLQGYNYEFVTNFAWSPGSHHFLGIINFYAARQIRSFNPSTVLVYGWAYLSHLHLLWIFERRLPVLFRGDSKLIKNKSQIKGQLKSIILTRVYRYVEKVLYVGTANHAYFRKYGVQNSRLAFVPHAIDNSRISQDRSSEVLYLRQGLGIKSEEIVVLFTGKFLNMKNPALLIQAFCNIDNPNTHMLIVGSGPLEWDLKRLASGKSASNKIHFMPFQNQSRMPVIYQACDLFCMPTKSPGETWGLAVNEAMAAGKAVLASDEVGSAVDLVSAENGMTFQSECLTDLTIKLRALVASKSKLTHLGANSKQKIAQWSLEKQVEHMLTHVH